MRSAATTCRRRIAASWPKRAAVILPFRTSKGLRNRFQINFRNHRKIVVIDGNTAYVGGMNVGDEYLGEHPRLRHMARYAHAKSAGPSCRRFSLRFSKIGIGPRATFPSWIGRRARRPTANRNALALASDPSDMLETCGLFFVHAINAARKRIWIASPYFVPDLSLIYALQLAALRGVDVRVMLPERPDHILVYLSGFSYIAEAEPAGVKFYRYEPGFMHHKVILVDDDLAAVGTANFDNRSIRLNFELMLILANREFAAAVSKMLEERFGPLPAGDVRRAGNARLLVSIRRAPGATDGAGAVAAASRAAEVTAVVTNASCRTRLLEPHRQTGAGEEVVRSIVEPDARADVPLHVVVEQHGETTVEVILGVVRVGAARHKHVPFRIAADVVGPSCDQRSTTAQIPHRHRPSRRRPRGSAAWKHRSTNRR